MNFDLNIDNYKRDELIEIFELPSVFNKELVENKQLRLQNSIINNRQISKEIQIKTINFLTKAKNIILNEGNIVISSKPDKTQNTNTFDSNYSSQSKLSKTPIDNITTEYPLQLRNVVSPTLSFPSEFYPGVINPIKKRINKINLLINTKFRENYYSTSSTNFNLQLPTNFNNVVEMQLSSFEMPFSYYAISKQYGNNFFSISVTDTATNILNTSVITIPDGNYDQFSVAVAINNVLISLGSPFDLISFQADLSVATLSNKLIGTNKMLVGPNIVSDVSLIELDFQTNVLGNSDAHTQLPLKLGWMLGFRNGYYSGSLNYVSEGQIDVTGPKYIFLVVDDYNNNVHKNFYSALNESVLNNNILAQFPVINASPFNYYIENSLVSNSSPPRSYFGPININSMTIQLIDEYGRIIDLNNMDYNFSLRLSSIYDL